MGITLTKSKGYRIRIRRDYQEYVRYSHSRGEAEEIYRIFVELHPSQRGKCKGKPTPRPMKPKKPIIGRPKVAREPIQVPCGWIVPAPARSKCKLYDKCPDYYPTCLDLRIKANYYGWKEKSDETTNLSIGDHSTIGNPGPGRQDVGDQVSVYGPQ